MVILAINAQKTSVVIIPTVIGSIEFEEIANKKWRLKIPRYGWI